MSYRKYNPETRLKAISTKLVNPNISYHQLAALFNIASPETIQYWMRRFLSMGYPAFKDHRHRQKGAVSKRKTIGQAL